MVEKSLDLSYQKSAYQVSGKLNISGQTVMNSIRELGKVENKEVKIREPKKGTKIIYIEAGEDHVAMQDGTNKQIKLAYVHTGKKQVSKVRYQLDNKRYFKGEYKNSEDLWLEVADYLEEAYDLDIYQEMEQAGLKKD